MPLVFYIRPRKQRVWRIRRIFKYVFRPGKLIGSSLMSYSAKRLDRITFLFFWIRIGRTARVVVRINRIIFDENRRRTRRELFHILFGKRPLVERR